MPKYSSLSTLEFYLESLKKQCLEAPLNRLQKFKFYSNSNFHRRRSDMSSRVRTGNKKPSVLLKGWLDLASRRLYGQGSPSIVFTFVSEHPCKHVLSVIRVCWAVRIGSKQELFVACVWWAVRTGIKLWLSVTGVRTLLLAVQTVFRENRLSDL